MKLSRPCLSTLLLALLLAAELAGPPAKAQSFLPVSDSEHQLTAVPGHPGAPAAVLHKRAELRLESLAAGGGASLDVSVRIKILTESGKARGQVAVAHGADAELVRFAGRTVLADGTVVPLPDDAVFIEERSQARESFVTKAAFPAVAVGAVLDYRFRLRLGSLAVEPWRLDEDLPTLYSELVVEVPRSLEIASHVLGPAPVQRQSDVTATGHVTRFWAEDLPALVEEPYGPPLADLATRVAIIPLSEQPAGGEPISLYGEWSEVCRRFLEEQYRPAERRARQVKKEASRLAAGAKGSDEAERIQTLFDFVRDDVLTVTGSGPAIAVAKGTTLDDVLAARRGSVAEKALLLATMLESVGIEARLLWAGDWRQGHPDLEVVSPSWFTKVLVMAGKADTLLDPSDPALGAGRLSPTQEGTRALVVDARRPEVRELEATPAEGHRRAVKLDLVIDVEGLLAGHGRLVLTGHHAWFYLRRLGDPAAIDEAWRRWLEEHLGGLAIGEVTARELVDEQRIEVGFTVGQHPEDVLGDEVSLLPSRPLGPVEQRLTIPPESRRAPVHLAFADRDEIDLRLRWPPGWEVELLPENVEHVSTAGRAIAEIEVDAAARQLEYRRRFEISRTRFSTGEEYVALRELYGKIAAHDGREIVLVKVD